MGTNGWHTTRPGIANGRIQPGAVSGISVVVPGTGHELSAWAKTLNG